LAYHRLRVACVLAVLTAAAVSLAACGRNGPPEAPPGPAITPAPPTAAAPLPAPSTTAGGPLAPGQTAQQNAVKNGFDASGNPVAPPGDKKSFFLDFLLQ
jgi:predicted small lipoprotein YifL